MMSTENRGCTNDHVFSECMNCQQTHDTGHRVVQPTNDDDDDMYKDNDMCNGP